MINLGPYSGKNCPNVRFQPTVIDRILEGTALLIVLVTWISILIVLLPFILLFHLYLRGEKRCVSKFGRSENI